MTPASSSGIAAVRGAIQVSANRAGAIHEATARLLVALLERNGLAPEQIVSAVFTATPDLDADFPAHAARKLGWTEVPLLGAVEMPVPGALARVVRVLLTVQGVRPGTRLSPAYLDGAAALRPDLARRDGAAPRRPAPAPREDAAARTRAGANAESPPTDARSAPARRRVALIGLGQIGGSIGLALGSAGRAWERAGFDADPATLAAAHAAGAVDRAAGSLADACAGADLAVIAVPVDAIAAAVDAAAAALPEGAALLDTGSARAGVTEALERAAARGLAAMGGHPLAGREGRGFAAASADLMRGARFVLLPLRAGEMDAADGMAAPDGAGETPPNVARTDEGSNAAPPAIPAIVASLLEALGAEPLLCAPAAHDAALARTSHLPYLVARALAAVGEAPHRLGLSGPGFRDMTRLAGSDPRMAEAYCRANAREIASAWRELRDEIERRLAGLDGNAARASSEP